MNGDIAALLAKQLDRVRMESLVVHGRIVECGSHLLFPALRGIFLLLSPFNSPKLIISAATWA